MKYKPQLDGLRALAILAVFIQHAFPVPLLWAGVDLFFILSGYLITSILLRDCQQQSFGSVVKHFYLRRAERILPPYLLLLVLVAIFAPGNLDGMGIYLATFTQNLPFAAHTMQVGALVPLWSLAVEQHFYLVWPAVIFFLPRRWVIRLLLATLVIVPVLRAVCTSSYSSPDAIYSLTPFRVDAIAVGALAAFVLPHLYAPTAIRWAKAAFASGCVLYVAGNHFAAFHRQANSAVFNSLGYSLNLLLLGGLFVWTVLDEDSVLTRVLSFSWLRGFGRISYTFYLLHFGVLCMVRDHMPRVEAAVVTFAVSTALATASWFVLEKPILHNRAAVRRRQTAVQLPVRASFSTARHLSLGAE